MLKDVLTQSSDILPRRDIRFAELSGLSAEEDVIRGSVTVKSETTENKLIGGKNPVTIRSSFLKGDPSKSELEGKLVKERFE